MSAYLSDLQEKINARILRERVLIFLSAIAVVFMLWNFIIQAPLDKKMQDIKTQLTTAETLRTTTQTEIATLTQALLNDPDTIKKAQIVQLQADILQVENQLQSASHSLIKAEQLPQALHDALEKTSQLTLLQATTLPAHELQFLPLVTSENNAATEVQKTGVYEHVVELRVAGNYFQVVEFLTALEALPWRFYWQRMDYKVMQYPNAEIILRVYTLSSEEGLLGV